MTQLLNEPAEVRPEEGRPSSFGPARLSAQDIELDVDAQLVFRNGRPLPRLPHKEFLLLRYLFERAGRVVTREEVMGEVWGSAVTDAGGKTLDVHMRRLRGRIEQDPRHPLLIRTLRGIGYVLDVTPVPTRPDEA